MGFRYRESGKKILEMLKDAGYTSYKLQTENILNQTTLQKLRHDQMVSMGQIEKICKLLKCHPNEIIEYTEE